MTFSLIIPSYASGKLLDLCLESVFSHSPADIELIVVDSSPERLPEELRVRYPQVHFIISQERLFAGQARNRGIEKASGEWLIFLDVDCKWNSTWWDSAKKLIDTYPEVDAFIGRIDSNAEAKSWDFALHVKEFHEFLGDKVFEPRFVSSGNLLIRSRLVKEVGGFREDVPMCTDLSFLDRLKGKELRLLYWPDLSILHRDFPKSKDRILQKVLEMGRWRGKIDESLSDRLRLPAFVRALNTTLLALVFIMTIYLRLLRLSPRILVSTHLSHRKLLHLAWVWAKGLRIGLSEGLKA